jgi:hypothetical protein
VVDGGGGEPRLCSIYPLAKGVRGGEPQRTGDQKNFPPPRFVLFPLFASDDGLSGSFSASVSVRFRAAV